MEHYSLYEIVGESGSGKSTFCYFLMLNYIITTNKSVVYIHTTKTEITRIKSIALKFSELFKIPYDDIINKIVVYKFDSLEFSNYIKRATSKNSDFNFGMIFVDTFKSLVDLEFSTQNKMSYKDRENYISSNLKILKEIILNLQVFVILVNECTTKFDKNNIPVKSFKLVCSTLFTIIL